MTVGQPEININEKCVGSTVRTFVGAVLGGLILGRVDDSTVGTNDGCRNGMKDGTSDDPLDG